MLRDAGLPVATALLVACLAGCAESVAATAEPPDGTTEPAAATEPPTAKTEPDPAATEPDPATARRGTASTAPTPQAPATAPAAPPVTPEPHLRTVARARTPTVTSDGRPRRALLTVPALGIRQLPVVPYRGRTDDGAGTTIQNRGVAASPYGAHGGVGPGGVGNYQVTAHRVSSTRAFNRLPALDPGDRVYVDVGATRFVYEIRKTRRTSFRSDSSLAEQRAAVPGRPGATAARAYLTLSTCATPEDHAAGNYWADEHGNPEHRIDKIGVLVSTASRR